MDDFKEYGKKLKKASKKLNDAMNKKKDTNFSCFGLVHPSEYNWEEQFLSIKNSREMYISLDKGKVMGLCKYIKELEEKLGEL